MSEAIKLSNLIKEAEEFDLLKAVIGVDPVEPDWDMEREAMKLREAEEMAEEMDNEKEDNEDYLEEMNGNDGNWPDRNR